MSRWLFVKKNSTAWTPELLASAPRMWLRSDAGVYDAETGGNEVVDGGAVRRWEDQGGVLNVHPTIDAAKASRAPTWHANVLNGLPVVRFRDEALESPVGAAMAASSTNIYADNPSAGAYFIVARRTVQHNGTSGYGAAGLVSVSNYAPNLAMPSAGSPTQAKNPTQFWLLNGVNQYTGNPADYWDSQPLVSPNEWILLAHNFAWAVEANGFNQVMRIDGGAHTLTPPSATPTSQIGTGAQSVLIGGRYSRTTDVLTGEIAEIVYVSGQLWSSSTDDRDRIEGYLAHRWGLTANLPAGHPYKSAAPTS